MNPELSQIDAVIARHAKDVLRGTSPRLEESVLYSLLGPGKRIRPRLVLAVAEALELDFSVAQSLATAIEMVHSYTLVHDDLPAMDDDDVRRGRPTNHKVYGEGLAVLAGDSLALLAPDLLLRLGDRLTAPRLIAVTSALLEAAGARGVIAGQAAEMDLGATSDLEGLFEIFRLKTGSLFRASLTMPAIAAGAEETLISALGRLGDDLGVAFQIADDLEDDFSVKRKDRAHIAYYSEVAAMKSEASRRLTLPSALPARVRANLEPFLAELRAKIDRSTG